MTKATQSIRLERVQGVLYLSVGNDRQVRFEEKWVKDLKSIPTLDFLKCMDYFRGVIYKTMGPSERKCLPGADLTELPRVIQEFAL